MPEAVRSANNLSNGEIISFADEFTALGEFAGEKLEVVEPCEEVLVVARPADNPANRLLHRLDFKSHGLNLRGLKPVVNRRHAECKRISVTSRG
jgi:hypothetical protein